MLNEFEYLYNIYCDVSMFDASGAMKPDAYQRICVNVVERHLNAIELDVERLVAAYGVSWVLLGLTVQILRPFKPGETITARTRHTNRKGAAYRRDIILCDESGGTVALAASFSSLLDINTRHICRDKTVNDKIDLPDSEALFEASSRFKPSLDDLSFVEAFSVRPSWIDSVGHVNNARYGEFTYDALTDKKRSSLKELKRLEIYFTGELTVGDGVVIKSLDNDSQTVIAGIRASDEKMAFAAKLEF